MKIFVTPEYMNLCTKRVKALQTELARIRKEKHDAYAEDTNTWHDNFAYESLTREEKQTEIQLLHALKDLDNYCVFDCGNIDAPKTVGIYCRIKICEENTETYERNEKTICIVPLGAEDNKKQIYSYNSPLVQPLIGAHVGDERTIKIPRGTFKITVLQIEKMDYSPRQ